LGLGYILWVVCSLNLCKTIFQRYIIGSFLIIFWKNNEKNLFIKMVAVQEDFPYRIRKLVLIFKYFFINLLFQCYDEVLLKIMKYWFFWQNCRRSFLFLKFMLLWDTFSLVLSVLLALLFTDVCFANKLGQIKVLIEKKLVFNIRMLDEEIVPYLKLILLICFKWDVGHHIIQFYLYYKWLKFSAINRTNVSTSFM
jgi:hypothetical protein